ncbi:hypothetical protein [Hespellia stercorisuis]|uniref:Uncharacterized protein n=1 Tax=Hespellia stercorisuis DSM 15480 TaxID=1121950 RepID=A0A1M6QL79_9FIRM|nr:hypothetical protein [Hespellia stercorisuis]SHK20986.1 hypothetical protein SAMN02745243_02456 [Hespellia stercorisuis DSM 15480]
MIQKYWNIIKKNNKFFIGLLMLLMGCVVNQSEAKAWWSALYPDLGLEQATRPISSDSRLREPTVTSDFQIKWYFGEDRYDEFFSETFCK